MIYLLIGTPGSGKTLSAMELMEKWGKENPQRRIYAANIEGLTLPGVLPLDDEGVLSWHQQCDKDSLVVVDEAQRYWRASRGGDPSQAIIEMETHRHDGIDIVLMTQHPTFIHANIRKLVNVHIHLVAHTKSSALRWEWRECHDDVQETSLRMSGEFKEWKYPAHLYPFYKSATMHTKRAKRPWSQVKGRIAGAVALVMVLGIVGVGVSVFMGAKDQASGTSAKPAVGSQAVPVRSGEGQGQGIASSAPRGDRAQPMTRLQYVDRLTPRIDTQPWSAPVYDGQQVTSHPQIFCVAKADDSDCHCITEQGTRYALELAQCLNVAKYGPAYDPFKPERRRDDERERGRDRVLPSTPELSGSVASAEPGIKPAALPDGIPQPSRLVVASE